MPAIAVHSQTVPLAVCVSWFDDFANVETPCMAEFKRQQETAMRRRAALRRIQRAPVYRDTCTTIRGEFEVPTDIAPLVHDPQLLAFMREATTRTVHIRDQKDNGLFTAVPSTARARLLFEFCHGTPLRQKLHAYFVDSLRRRMARNRQWSRACHTRAVTRYDYHLADTDVVIQTLMMPRPPFLVNQNTAVKPHQDMLLALSHNREHRPTHIRIRQVDAVQFQWAPSVQSCGAESVEKHVMYVFKAGAWVFRMEDIWRGANVQDVETAATNIEPETRLTMELLFTEYHARKDVQFMLASALLKLRQIVNDSLLAEERISFAPTVTRVDMS